MDGSKHPAYRDAKHSVDTTMGFTALGGLVMGTRSHARNLARVTAPPPLVVSDAGRHVTDTVNPVDGGQHLLAHPRFPEHPPWTTHTRIPPAPRERS